MTTDSKTNHARRTLLKAGAGASLTSLAGSDKLEKEAAKIGFIPLTDCQRRYLIWRTCARRCTGE